MERMRSFRVWEVLAVHIIDENVLPAVPTIYHVIDRVRIFHSHGARHGARRWDNCFAYEAAGEAAVGWSALSAPISVATRTAPPRSREP